MKSCRLRGGRPSTAGTIITTGRCWGCRWEPEACSTPIFCKPHVLLQSACLYPWTHASVLVHGPAASSLARASTCTDCHWPRRLGILNPGPLIRVSAGKRLPCRMCRSWHQAMGTSCNAHKTAEHDTSKAEGPAMTRTRFSTLQQEEYPFLHAGRLGPAAQPAASI